MTFIKIANTFIVLFKLKGTSEDPQTEQPLLKQSLSQQDSVQKDEIKIGKKT